MRSDKVPDQLLLIVADNYRLATHYAREHGLGREGVGWRYISSWRQMQGVRPGRFVVITIGELSPKDRAERWYVVELMIMHGFTRQG